MRPESPMKNDIFDSPSERWMSARHEAGHAVAALHYGCPFQSVSIERVGESLGKIRQMRCRDLGDVVATMCGPLAEEPWNRHRSGIHNFKMCGTDHARAQQANPDQIAQCVREALRFMKRRPVQQQNDRVSRALLERTTLTAADVRTISRFSRPLCSRDFPVREQ
jgi:hypothetical protein